MRAPFKPYGNLDSARREKDCNMDDNNGIVSRTSTACGDGKSVWQTAEVSVKKAA